MNFSPRPYQVESIRRVCAAPGFALLLDPGMGKTSSTLAALQLLKQHGEMRAALVVAPIRPCRNVWPAEVAKWVEFNDLRVSLVLGSAAQRKAGLAAPADLYLINPENVPWLAKEVAAGRIALRADVLVVDESTKFKNPTSQRFKALKLLLPYFRRRVILTGTPAPQSLEDLWAQIYLLDEGQRLGRNITAFRRTYFVEEAQWGGYSTWRLRKGADAEIFARIADICLRLDAKDHLELPEDVYNTISVDLPAPAAVAYRKLERDFLLEVAGGTVTAGNAAAASMKLRQVCNGCVYGEFGEVHRVHDAKLGALQDLIEEQSGQPLLVAVAFQHDADAIRTWLRDRSIPYLGGGISGKDSDRVVADWNAGRLPVLIAHPSSVAHGLNLQSGGRAVAWFGLTWSLEDYIQFNNRVGGARRAGQATGAVIHHIVAAGTIDEAILGVLAQKDANQARLFDVLQDYARKRTEE